MPLLAYLKTLNKNPLPVFSGGYAETVADFWDQFVKPRLPKKHTVIGLYKLLSDYVNDKDAVFAVRTFGNWKDSSKNNKDLRRGFYNISDNNVKLFYTDNFYAAYFCKMAIDDYVPDYDEFKNAMISREFPARFGRHDSKLEKVKAAYSIDGKNGKDPLFTTNGYKIAHIFDAGDYYLIENQIFSIKEICDKYFPRGNYDDWKEENDGNDSYFVRHLKSLPDEAKDFLKAHFLRFVCPLNYFLTPGKNHHKTEVKVYMNDIAESIELQAYAIEQMKSMYGSTYNEFLNKIMLPRNYPNKSNGASRIGITYKFGLNKNSSSSSKKKQKVPKTTKVTNNSGLKVGQFAFNTFKELLENNKLSAKEIKDLKNKSFSSSTFSISYPILVDINKDTFDNGRYYKKVVCGKYRICSQWYDRNLDRINHWLFER